MNAVILRIHRMAFRFTVPCIPFWSQRRDQEPHSNASLTMCGSALSGVALPLNLCFLVCKMGLSLVESL